MITPTATAGKTRDRNRPTRNTGLSGNGTKTGYPGDKAMTTTIRRPTDQTASGKQAYGLGELRRLLAERVQEAGSINALAAEWGVEASKLWGWTRGGKAPAFSSMGILADKLGLDVLEVAQACGFAIPNDSVARQLLAAALKKGHSFASLARISGLSARTVRQTLLGETIPSAQTLEALTKALGVDRNGAPRRRKLRKLVARNPLDGLVKEAAVRQNIPLEEAISRSGVARTALFRVFAGKGSPSAQTLHRLWKNLDIPIEDLMEAAGVEGELWEAAIRYGKSIQRLRDEEGIGAGQPSSIETFTRYAEVVGLSREERLARGREWLDWEGDRSPLGRLIADVMILEGVNLTELAKRIGVTHQAASSWMRGLSRPSTEAQEKLAKLAGVSVKKVAELADATYRPYRQAGLRVRRARNANQLSRAELADKLGIGEWAVAAIEMGTRLPDDTQRKAIASILDEPALADDELWVEAWADAA